MAHWKPVTIFHSFKMMRFHWPLRTAWPQGFLCSANFRQKLGLSCCLKGVLPHTAGYPTLEIHKVRGFLIFWSKLGTIYMLLLIQWGTFIGSAKRKSNSIGLWVSTAPTPTATRLPASGQIARVEAASYLASLVFRSSAATARAWARKSLQASTCSRDPLVIWHG